MTDDRSPAGKLPWVPSLAGTAALIAIVLATVVPLEAAQKDPVASVTGGRVKGRLLSRKAGAVFKGIPFGRPPVGALRWREPQRVERWRGVRDAGEFCAPCAQAPAGWNDADAEISREDCLYLNVWTPAWPPSGGAPVMVWIHGGGNTAGTGGADPLYDGTRLTGRDVVLVTFEYRLGVFGFFAHPELTLESRRRASGNYGILDQIAALRWVRANIAAFGGDPKNVTVFGQSAGALDLAFLMTTRLPSSSTGRTLPPACERRSRPGTGLWRIERTGSTACPDPPTRARRIPSTRGRAGSGRPTPISAVRP